MKYESPHKKKPVAKSENSLKRRTISYQCFLLLWYFQQNIVMTKHVFALTPADTCYQFIIANRLLKILKFFWGLFFGCEN